MVPLLVYFFLHSLFFNMKINVQLKENENLKLSEVPKYMDAMRKNKNYRQTDRHPNYRDARKRLKWH